jgi:hypothetical protein
LVWAASSIERRLDVAVHVDFESSVCNQDITCKVQGMKPGAPRFKV